MRVKEAMKRSVRTIDPDRPLSEAAEAMQRFGIDHLLVVERGVPVGLLSDGDAFRHQMQGDIRSAMTRRLVTIDAAEPVVRAANVMRGHEIKCLVVMESGSVAGIITSSDILEVMSRSGHKERPVLRDRGRRRRVPRST